ncbi:MAG: TAT-variant-translocated molybdopterin oxidoreductase, partial [Phycisphaerales bacterium]|nr:TAT-variant-translocated molybdopterin oxidoreductase [Phycisphaerales bacterium]
MASAQQSEPITGLFDMSSVGESGRIWWRGLDEVVESPAFADHLSQEFPTGAAEMIANGHDRRHFLRIMGASMAMAGLGVAGCRRWPTEHIAPYAHRPEGTMPGVAEFFASCMEFNGVAQGVLVTSNDGRPTKIEGNPDQTDSRGATDAFTQASILELYDPDRSRAVRRGDSVATIVAEIRKRMGDGAGVAVLAQPNSSPTLHRMRRAFMTVYPKASWTEYTPINDQNERQGMQAATGGAWRPLHDLSHARVIVSLGADLLGAGPGQVRNTRGWAEGRTAASGHMNRMWVAETAMTLTGANADERQAMRPAEIVALAAKLAGAGIDGLVELST